MPERLTQIDETSRNDHFHLTAADECYHVLEYTSGKSYDHSRANGLIQNFKKSPTRRNRPEYRYKIAEIRNVAAMFQTTISADYLTAATLIPIPPSKVKGDPEYDDRMTKALRLINPGANLDIRELIYQTASTRSSHASGGERVTVDELLEVYRIDQALTQPPPRTFALFDDVLTAGTHFRAASTILRRSFPDVPIAGFFIARRILSNEGGIDLAALFE